MTIDLHLEVTGPVAIIVAVIPLRGPRKAAPRSVPPMPAARVIETTAEPVEETARRVG